MPAHLLLHDSLSTRRSEIQTELGVRLAAFYGGESAEDKAAFAQAVERAFVRGLGGQWNLAPDADHCYDAVGAIKEQRREERTAAAASAAAAAAAGEAAAGEAAAGETADAGATDTAAGQGSKRKLTQKQKDALSKKQCPGCQAWAGPATAKCKTEGCNHAWCPTKSDVQPDVQRLTPWNGSSADQPPLQTRKSARNAVSNLQRLMSKVKVLAAALGMEALVVLCGVMNSKAAATRAGEEHICFNKYTPFISQLGVPGFGEDSGLSIGVVAAGTGGPLTAALDKPAQGSQAANMCLEYLAGQACMLHHQRLQELHQAGATQQAAAANAGAGGQQQQQQSAGAMPGAAAAQQQAQQQQQQQGYAAQAAVAGTFNFSAAAAGPGLMGQQQQQQQQQQGYAAQATAAGNFTFGAAAGGAASLMQQQQAQRQQQQQQQAHQQQQGYAAQAAAAGNFTFGAAAGGAASLMQQQQPAQQQQQQQALLQQQALQQQGNAAGGVSGVVGQPFPSNRLIFEQQLKTCNFDVVNLSGLSEPLLQALGRAQLRYRHQIAAMHQQPSPELVLLVSQGCDAQPAYHLACQVVENGQYSFKHDALVSLDLDLCAQVTMAVWSLA
ncbi:hypothetical protein OEZ86_010015 [Tetradesmus obliquus]|nr:hypothetical protein OEZ86_010015 [Tetradesmus obliquus]